MFLVSGHKFFKVARILCIVLNFVNVFSYGGNFHSKTNGLKLKEYPIEIISLSLIKFCNSDECLEAAIIFENYPFKHEDIINLFEIGIGTNDLKLLSFLLSHVKIQLSENLFDEVSWIGITREALQLFLLHGVKIRKIHEIKFFEEKNTVSRISQNFSDIESFLHFDTEISGYTCPRDMLDGLLWENNGDMGRGGEVIGRKLLGEPKTSSALDVLQKMKQYHATGVVRGWIAKLLSVSNH